MIVRATEEFTGVGCLGFPLSKSFSGYYRNPQKNIVATNEAVVLGGPGTDLFYTSRRLI